VDKVSRETEIGPLSPGVGGSLLYDSMDLFLRAAPVPLSLLVKLVYTRIIEEAILPLQIMPLTWTQLQQEANRISVAKGLYQRHVASLSQGHFGTSEAKAALSRT